MSNRAVKHSSRYKGPAGDSRPEKEIFAHMEKRAQENASAEMLIISALDEALSSKELASLHGRLDLIKNTCFKWMKDRGCFGGVK